MFLVLGLGLESVCPWKGCPWPWPQIFFVSLASSLVSSTPPLIISHFYFCMQNHQENKDGKANLSHHLGSKRVVQYKERHGDTSISCLRVYFKQVKWYSNSCVRKRQLAVLQKITFVSEKIKLKSASHFLMQSTPSLQEFILHQNAPTSRLRHSKFEEK